MSSGYLRRRWTQGSGTRWRGSRRTRTGWARNRIGQRNWPYRRMGGTNLGLTTQEYKSSTINLATQNPFDTGLVILITTIARGTSDNERIGNVIVMRKVMMRVCMNSTGTSIGGCYRLMLLYDKQFNKSTPTPSDILVAGAPHSSRDFLDLNNRNRFITIFNSGIFNIGANTNDNDNRSIEFYCKCKAETIFSGAGSAEGDLTSGALIILLVGDGTVIGNAAAFDIQIRMRYQDGQLRNQLPKFWDRRTKGNWQAG